MAKNLEALLHDDEIVIEKAKISIFSKNNSYLFGLLLLLIGLLVQFEESNKGQWFLIIGLLFWLYAVLPFLTSEILLTNKRFLYKKGLLKPKQFIIHLSEIKHCYSDRNYFGVALRYGNLIFLKKDEQITILREIDQAKVLSQAVNKQIGLNQEVLEQN